jgi:hypothetical protein
VHDRIIGSRADKPAEHRVSLKLDQKQPLRMNPVKRLQQCGKQKLIEYTDGQTSEA